MNTKLIEINMICVILLILTTIATSAAIVLDTKEMNHMLGGCPSYCYITFQCGDNHPYCESRVFGQTRCNPALEPPDCINVEPGDKYNDCRQWTVSDACNSTSSSDPACIKGVKTYCGDAYICECVELPSGWWKCKREDDIRDGTCGYYHPATSPCQ